MGLREWFVSSDKVFFDAFDQHATIAVGAAEELRALTRAAGDLESHVVRIHDAEQAADAITHHLFEHMHRAFVSSIDRDQLHRLIGSMDDVVDFIEAAASRFVLYEIRSMTGEVVELVDALATATDDMREGVRALRDRNAAPAVLDACVRINQAESQADAVFRHALAHLFKEQKDPIVVMKWKEIYESIETAVDRCEDVANVLEGIVLER